MSKSRKIVKNISKPLIRLFIMWGMVVLTIQIIAPSPSVYVMPANCPEKSGNCVRIAYDGSSYRYNNLDPPVIQASISEVNSVISDWFSDDRRGKILHTVTDAKSNTSFLHIKENTKFFYFPDDIYVKTNCLEFSNSTVVTLQSQSRLGNGDMGVNFERLSELINFLENYSWSGDNCHFNN
ncbi:MAG: hypothetical protein CMB56_004735 [Methanobacteriota archaeon]|nr:MAG: hypothetical protein CMB56_004735 [Euryarchaeota archaeon]|tara:strand:+ start:844 stop:1386 length:543 start_codon:yes stop_codon:yes gene_type:complete